MTLQVIAVWCSCSWCFKIFISDQKWCICLRREWFITASIDFKFNDTRNVTYMWHSHHSLHCNATLWHRRHHLYASFHANNVIWILLTGDNDTKIPGEQGTGHEIRTFKWQMASYLPYLHFSNFSPFSSCPRPVAPKGTVRWGIRATNTFMSPLIHSLDRGALPLGCTPKFLW